MLLLLVVVVVVGLLSIGGGGHEKSFQGVLVGGSEISKNPLFLHYKIA